MNSFSFTIFANLRKNLMGLEKVFDKKKRAGKNVLVRLLEYSKKTYPDIISFIDALTQKVESNVQVRNELKTELDKLFKNVSPVAYLVDSGIIRGDGIFSMFKKRIGDLILPEIQNDNTLSSIINEVFYNGKHLNTVKIIPKDRWERLYNALYIEEDEGDRKRRGQHYQKQILEAITIIIDRISGGFSDKEIMRYSPDMDYFDNPFTKLSFEIRKIVEKPDSSYDALAIKQSIANCRKFLQDILLQKDHKGISFKITVEINRLKQQLQRLQALLTNLNDIKTTTPNQFLVNATKTWIDFYSPKNWLSNQLSSTLYIVTFLATYHNGKTGETYITSTVKEYKKMFWTAAGGGFLVAFMCLVKLSISEIDNSSPFFKAFFYSISYALGFSIIYLLHWTLATKQPSMTAARLAQSLVPKTGTELKINDFTSLFSQLCRSQFIAFIGNVVAVFITATIVFYLLYEVMGYDIIKYSTAYEYNREIVTMDWRVFHYASIAGVFLFISGMISGLTINHQRYNSIPERIFHHPLLKRFFSIKTRRNISNWYERNNGGLVGNIAFGFMMGSAFLIGDFMGIPFDVRHITFVSGNFALALGRMGYHLELLSIIIGFVSIFIIGWFNFIISFTLSLYLAMRSNNVPFYKFFPMVLHITKAFFRSPRQFFFPPGLIKSEKMEEVDTSIQKEEE